VREEADLLDDVADRAPQLGHVVVADLPAVDADVAARERDQPVDDLERRRLTSARRPDENADLPCGHGEREVVDRRAVAAGIDLRRFVEDELGRLARHAVNLLRDQGLQADGKSRRQLGELELSPATDDGLPRLPAETSLRDALALLIAERSDALLVTDGGGAPLGVVTREELLR
jgi:CBS domain-containing protein